MPFLSEKPTIIVSAVGLILIGLLPILWIARAKPAEQDASKPVRQHIESMGLTFSQSVGGQYFASTSDGVCTVKIDFLPNSAVALMQIGDTVVSLNSAEQLASLCK